MEQTQKQPRLPTRLVWPVRRHGLYQTRNVTNATAKFFWERVERLRDYLDEMFTLHPSPTERNKGPLTPSSRRRLRRHHRHFLCRRLRLPLRLLPRLALVEGGHRQLSTDQKGLRRGVLDVFCSCPMLRLVRLGKRRHSQWPGGRRARRSILMCGFGTPVFSHFGPEAFGRRKRFLGSGGAQLVPAPGTAESSRCPSRRKADSSRIIEPVTSLISMLRHLGGVGGVH